MKPTNFIHAARAKKQAEVIRSLEQAFSDFPYPVYLFGSFANGNFHGYSDIDLVILVSKQQARQAYNLACDKLAGLRAPYDILTCQSVDELDNTIKSALHPIHAPEQAETPLKRQQGMTLIELLIAMLLGAFLLGGVIQIFVNTKQTYRMQESLSRLQENGRFAMEFLTTDIRMAGFLGCGSRSNVTPSIIANPPSAASANVRAIWGNDYDTGTTTWIPALTGNISGLNPAPTAGTDIVTIEYAGACDAQMTGNMGTTNANIQITAPNNCGIVASSCGAGEPCTSGSVLMISDCTTTDIFRASSASASGTIQTVAHANNVNTSNNLSKAYQTDAQLMIFVSKTYFIRPGASGQPALWVYDNTRITPNPVELVEGIENMQVTYGVDNSSDSVADYYVNGASVTDWAQVVSVRISLLARTIDNNIASQVLDYTYNGAEVTPTDRRIRRVFTSTIALRNRLP